MRKLLFLCLLVWIAAGPVQAQRGWNWLGRLGTKPAAQGKAKLAEINVSYQLNRRMAQTYRQAEQAQMQLPLNRNIIMGEPIQNIFKTGELNAHELYPKQTFLKNSSQTGKYLVARNNRLFVQETRRMKQLWAQIDENLPRLRQEATATEQPENTVKWLADSLPAQTTQLFVGEAHGYPEINQFVAQLTQELRSRQPKREIILFTEFLPENFKWTGNRPSILTVPEHAQKFFPTWDKALQAQVPVIGLELLAAVDDECEVRYLRTDDSLDKQTVWSSLEGVRLRNERWEKTLATYRAQHPDALFIIYTGADHSMYNRPFTLATPGENTFVTVLYPERYEALAPSGRFTGTYVAKNMRGPLERLVDKLDFQRLVIKWQSPDLPAIAGFDVRIKVPVTLPNVDK